MTTYRYTIAPGYRVVDGDTIDATLVVDFTFDVGFHVLQTVRVTTRQKLRLARLYAPELSEPTGPVAKAELERLLSAAKELYAVTSKDDKYGRYLVEIEADGVNISDRMVENGFATHRPAVLAT